MADTVEDTLAFWHPQRDEQLAVDYLNWGIIAPGSSADAPVRLRNMSATYTASGITIAITTFNINTPTPRVDLQHLLSLDGAHFQSLITVGTLKPQATSAIITVRRVTATDATLGFGEFQLYAHATDWS